jgi:hypothetical protein
MKPIHERFLLHIIEAGARKILTTPINHFLI